MSTTDTTPRDAIGLSDRLRNYRVWSQPHQRYDAVELTLEAATALDALQARVKELEAETERWAALALKEDDCRKMWQDRALRAEQERDEAYELAAKVAEGLQCRNCNSVVPSGDGIGLCCGRPDYDSISDVSDAFRRLAAGSEKEGK